MSVPVIHSISYLLGEHKHFYKNNARFNALVSERRFADDAAVFGLGYYYSTERDLVAIGAGAASRSLALAGLPADTIDAVLFCSTSDASKQGQERPTYRRLLKALDLPRAYPIGLTLNGCTSLISALDVGAALLSRPSCNHLLIITADKIADEDGRFVNYAFFSDGALSLVLSKRADRGFSLVDTVLYADGGLMGDEANMNDTPLHTRAAQALFSRNGIDVARIKKVLTSNIFSLITAAKEMRVGVKKAQLFMDNVPLLGHCFSADTLINLCDYTQHNPPTDGDYFLLAANSIGLRGLALLKYEAGGSGIG